MSRKFLAIVLALAMVFALALTACGGEKAEDSTKAPDKGSTKAAEKETTAAEAEEDFEEESIDWWFWQGMDNTPDWDEYVHDAIVEYVKENLNINLTTHFFSGSDYVDKLNAALTSGTAIDLVAMGSGINLMVWYDRNALAPLDDLLAKYAQDLTAKLPDYAFQACTIDGKIYAMPTLKDLATDIGYLYNETLLEELGLLDELLATPFENAKDYNDFFYKFLDVRNEQNPEDADLPCMKSYTTFWAYYKGDRITNGVFTMIPGLGCFEDKKSNEVFSVYETKEYLDMAAMINTWVKDGVVAYDSSNWDSENVYKKEGKLPGEFEWGLMTSEREAYAEYGWYEMLIHPQYAFTYTLQMHDAKHAIYSQSTESKQVAAMRFYNAIAEDPQLATSIRFGVEGIHWIRETDANGVIRSQFAFEGGRNADPTARNYYFWYLPGVGDLTGIYLPMSQPDEFFEIMLSLNANAKASDNMGFLLSTENISNEIASVSNVISEYHNDLMYGMLDDYEARIDAFNESLAGNGINAIVDEAQAQLDAFRG